MGLGTLLLSFSCSALSVALLPALLIGLKPALLLGFSRVVSLIDDLRLTFDNLRTYDIKLNLKNCVFGVPTGKLLGFIVSNRGIEANPAKIRALSQLATPTKLKQVQKLAGCVAALCRFISRLGEKALPLYRLL